MDRPEIGQLREQILRLTREYARLTHAANRPGDQRADEPFAPGASSVPYGGRVFDEAEVAAAVDSALDFWLTLGPQGAAFEQEFAQRLGVRSSVLLNSGSSANLLAVATLTSHKLPKEKRIVRGDEVITVAAGFPTTVAPIVQCGAVPVFIDADPPTGNALCDRLENAYSPGKTKAVMLAHALGNPFNLQAVLAFCRRHDLWLIEDNCDSLGSTYAIPVDQAEALGLEHLLRQTAKENTHSDTPDGQSRLPAIRDGRLIAYTGSFGDLSTQSFYPPHHMTMGEGGCLNIVRQAPLRVIAESFRDWGRDCWCASGRDNTCNKRFEWQLGELPEGYDHKYIYSHLGYNLKPLDLQAAIGREQLKKLPGFIEARKRNWHALRMRLDCLSSVLEFSLPTHATAWTSDGFQWDGSGCQSDCAWFGFMIRVKPTASFTHSQLAAYLDERKIGNRMFFGGNLVRQPAFVQLAKDRPGAFRVAGDLTGADDLMNTALFLGTYPGLTAAMLDYQAETLVAVVRTLSGS
jgi:CDP-6-deoxy-D-xylo-4-hexulose-3-dehydrase